LSDDSVENTLARLEEVSNALDAAKDTSHITTHEIAHAQRADRHANFMIDGIHQPKGPTKRRT
jgi:hypothetical protein